MRPGTLAGQTYPGAEAWRETYVRPLDSGQGLFVARSGRGRFVCAGDTALNPTARALAYGTQTVVAGFRCSSATSGMTCSSLRTGHGFFISVQRYRRF